MNCRDEFPELINKLGLKRGVEIGVAYGNFSEHLLANSNLEELISIDPWSEKYEGFNHTENPQEEADKAFRITTTRLKKYGPRSKIIRDRGCEISHIYDCELDFIYIDSSHKYSDTLREIELWWEKIRDGGIMAGHDYCNCYDVKKAVDEFAQRHNKNIETTIDDCITTFPVNSWYIFK